MKRMITSLFLVIAIAANGQDSVDEMMYKAYLNKDYAPDEWKKAILSREGELKSKDDKDGKFNVALSRYGLLCATMRTRDEDLFDDYYGATVNLLDGIIQSDKSWAAPQALLSATYGLKMGYSPMQGMLLGSKSNSLIARAKKLDPNSPLVWRVYANSKFFTPDMWGGNLDEAIEAYEKSISLFEARPSSLRNNWMYLDALVFLGQAYLKNGDTGKSIAIYEKALAIEPGFGWVKFSLLPKARAKAAK